MPVLMRGERQNKKAEGDVNILAVDENHLERSKNKSSGFNAGVTISYGNAKAKHGQAAKWAA